MGDEPIRLADEFWLSIHDDGFAHRATLPKVTRTLGLAGALLVELVDGGLAQVATGRTGSQHEAPSTDADKALLLHAVPGYEGVGDPALREVYGILVRDSDVPCDSATLLDGAGFRDPSSHRATSPRDHGGWTGDWNGRTPAQGNPYTSIDRTAYYPPSSTADVGMVGIPVRNLAEFLAIDNRAEQLVVNRLLTTGLVRYETRQRLFGSATKVIVPANSVISGRARARILAGLRPGRGLSLEPERLSNEPRGLTDFDKRMAALFAAASVFDVDQTSLTATEMKVLREQLRSGIPQSVTAVLREVSLVIRSVALNR